MADTSEKLGVHCEGRFLFKVIYSKRFNLKPEVICPIRSSRYEDSDLSTLTCCNPDDCPLVVQRWRLNLGAMPWTLENPDSRFRHLKKIGVRTYLEE